MNLRETGKQTLLNAEARGRVDRYACALDFLRDIIHETGELAITLAEDEANHRVVRFGELRMTEDAELELADIILCCLSLAYKYGVDLESVIEKKLLINENRLAVMTKDRLRENLEKIG